MTSGILNWKIWLEVAHVVPVLDAANQAPDIIQDATMAAGLGDDIEANANDDMEGALEVPQATLHTEELYLYQSNSAGIIFGIEVLVVQRETYWTQRRGIFHHIE
ncbi:uncharacterized protein BT62DRAFT_922988 [Guyanagaster necrorhizus]|uniref:Uncharacterized protein n=1 Tax=Guyanagaster necrorhizus TaxID=856835 RepID=A0A9P7VL48_9AGAR|nr:uncharacterized protein BT62DRAFT_922988 [Guyanagaster necrorhizus MCA 3950]KAG7441971.1 hypothetical protein BT62DRAFT_922988 [Guyanagaster necrorhizus MCA 3950]